MNRRRFLFVAATSALGGSALAVGCASTDTAQAPTTDGGQRGDEVTNPPTGRLLDGVSLEVHRDPG